MSYGASIIKNSVSIISGNFLNKILSIVVLFYLAGYLSIDQFGQYSFVVAYITFFGVFTDLGLNILMTRELSVNSADSSRNFGNVIAVRLILTLITTVVAIAGLYILKYPPDIIRLSAAYSFSLFISFRGLFFRNVFDIPFQVHLRMNYPSTINFLNEFLSVLVLIWLVYIEASLFSIILMMVLLNLPGFVSTAFFSTRLIKPVFEINVDEWARILKKSLPLGISVILEGIFIFIPFFLLSKLGSDKELGLYSLAFRLVSSLWIIPVAVMVSFQPKMSREGSSSRLIESFFTSYKTILIIGMLITLFTLFFSDLVIDIFTGGKYMEAVPVLSIMIWGTLLYFINSVFGYTFVAAKRQKVITLVWFAIVALCIISCVLLIPAYSHTGAAISYVISLGGGTLIYFVLTYRIFKVNMLAIMINSFVWRIQRFL